MPVTYYSDPEYFERLDGMEYPKVSPKRTHSKLQSAFLALFRNLAPGREIGAEWKFRIGKADGTDSALLPDVAYVARERVLALSPREREEPPFAPDIAVEIRSPGERKHLREAKIGRYLATGSRLVLDVDAKAREMYAHDARGCATLRCGDRFTNAEFPWLTFDVAAVFAELDD